LRLLVLNYEFPPLGGGAASVCHFLAREMVTLGHEVDLVTMGFRKLPREEVVDGIRVFRVPCFRRSEAICSTHEMISYALSALPTALSLARKNRYDLNHTHFIFPSAFTSCLLRKVTGLPYIVTAHGSDVQGYNPDRFKLEHRLFRPIWMHIVKNAARIVSPSRSLKEMILAQCDRTPVDVVPNAIDPSLFAPGEKRKVVLMVSRLLPRKGFQYVLEALSGLSTDFETVIVGDGPYEGALKEMAGRMGLRVRFMGWIEKDSKVLRELYATSSVFALPSEAENFPIALVEAMASGMAILTTTAGGCPEVVGDAALLARPRDVADMREKLGRLLSDAALRQDLGRRARQRVKEHFTWPSVARQYEAVFQNFIGRAEA